MSMQHTIEKTEIKFPRCTPESAGISSESIIKLMDKFKSEGIENHSFMIVRHGKVCAEAWAAPFAPEIPHTLYSFSKSFAATAIGFAMDEGIIVPKTGEPISLDTRIIDIFPEVEAKKKKPDPYDSEIRIRHMLRMQSGKKMNLLTDKSKVDWIEDYINAPFSAKPGTFWNYCNENSFMFCAAIKKLTSLTVTEYLMPRLFEPLGIDEPMWERNQEGVESGGWGMYLKTEDMAKFIQCYMDGGRFQGKQIIPEWWTKEATKIQVDNSIEIQPDNKAGYGYHFWMTGGAPGWRADGMFSQHGIALPEYDAVIVTTSAEPIEQKNLNAIWSVFPEAFSDDALPENPIAYEKLIERVHSYALPKLPKKPRRPELEKTVNKKMYHIDKDPFANLVGFPSSMLAMPITFMSIAKTGNIDKIRFVFKEDELRINWVEQDGKIRECIPVGLDGEYRYGRMNMGPVPYTTASIGCWNDDGTLSVSIRPLEAISARTMKVSFDGEFVKIKLGEDPDVDSIAEFLLASFEVMIRNKFIVNAAGVGFKAATGILDPTLKGKMIK